MCRDVRSSVPRAACCARCSTTRAFPSSRCSSPTPSSISISSRAANGASTRRRCSGTSRRATRGWKASSRASVRGHRHLGRHRARRGLRKQDRDHGSARAGGRESARHTDRRDLPSVGDPARARSRSTREAPRNARGRSYARGEAGPQASAVVATTPARRACPGRSRASRRARSRHPRRRSACRQPPSAPV